MARQVPPNRQPPPPEDAPDFVEASRPRTPSRGRPAGTPSFEAPAQSGGETAPARTPGVAQTPEFADAPAASDEQAQTAQVAAAMPGRGAPAAAPKSPWPARVAGAVTIIAIVAILLGIFLPREKPEVQPQAGPPQPQPSPSVTPQPNPYPQQQSPRMQVASPRPQPQPAPAPTPAPVAQQPSQQPQPTAQYGTCPTCGGTGEMPCPYPAAWHTSDGRLMMPEAAGLPDDGDFGTELREDLTGGVCPFCGGKLKMRCTTCGGSGKVRIDAQGRNAQSGTQAETLLGVIQGLSGGQAAAPARPAPAAPQPGRK